MGKVGLKLSDQHLTRYVELILDSGNIDWVHLEDQYKAPTGETIDDVDVLIYDPHFKFQKTEDPYKSKVSWFPLSEVRSFTKGFSEIQRDVPIIIASDYFDKKAAKEAQEIGAIDYIYLKAPFPDDPSNQFEAQRLLGEVQFILADDNEPLFDIPFYQSVFSKFKFYSEDGWTQDLCRRIVLASRRDDIVLLSGNSIEIAKSVARAIYHLSIRRRRSKRIVHYKEINLGGTRENNSIDETLFGVENADGTLGKVGVFEKHPGGTVLLTRLDKLSGSDWGTWDTLMRFIEEGDFYRINGKELIKPDCRLIVWSPEPIAELSIWNAIEISLGRQGDEGLASQDQGMEIQDERKKAIVSKAASENRAKGWEKHNEGKQKAIKIAEERWKNGDKTLHHEMAVELCKQLQPEYPKLTKDIIRKALKETAKKYNRLFGVKGVKK
ncbi:Sigma-54 interaction domain-containing protein [Desulfatibacillum alkenivorans DSM 16219]|jgi:hypothetical protein|uniref:Sigma-54 interaction domain-containing protein n=1 Tax=Desulfatibacillum alkenivorans DSM 16219 TaxID=1121393 RepID=A0A1M6QA40_9BACT|nr:sigma 54-interacting transcriptional regulator [Desulfatibacillum alkenivorans]SHK16953.1 Sigma-54 interaction domain-containing protein [Desulfatibacillum alkenivorans DSM 16219]